MAKVSIHREVATRSGRQVRRHSVAETVNKEMNGISARISGKIKSISIRLVNHERC